MGLYLEQAEHPMAGWWLLIADKIIDSTANYKATVTVGATTDFLAQSSSALTGFVPDQFNFTSVCL